MLWGRMRRPFSSAAELGTSSSPHSCKRRTDTAVGPARAGEYRAVLPSKWQCLEERLGSLGQLFTEDCVHCTLQHRGETGCPVSHSCKIHIYEVLVQDTKQTYMRKFLRKYMQCKNYRQLLRKYLGKNMRCKKYRTVPVPSPSPTQTCFWKILKYF